MTDDLVMRLRNNCSCNFPDTPCGAEEECRNAFEAADLIERLESVVRDDAKQLAAYHKWCGMNGCAPSSSDLISARKAMEER